MGGRIELDSVWVHLGPDARPARIEDFAEYAAAGGGRVVSTRLELTALATDGQRIPWPLRRTDIDLLGHVNNAAYWHAVEERLLARGPDLRRPIRARLDHLQAIDLRDDVWLAEVLDDTKFGIAFNVGHVESTVARAEITW